MHAIVKPASVTDVQRAVADAHAAGKPMSIAGGRHAMGGQQFGEAAILVDTRDLNRVLAFDSTNASNPFLWRFTTRRNLYSSPALGADGTLWITGADRNLYAISD